MRLMRRLALTGAIAAIAAGCGGGSASDSSATTAPAAADESTTTTAGETTTTAAPDETTTTVALPAGATAGLDDYNGDGELDPTCGIQDFAAGLVLRIPCEITTNTDPPENVTLVASSLFRLPTSTGEFDLTGTSADLVLARDDAGAKVFIFINNSDALFETGSSQIGSTDNMDATVRIVNQYFPGGRIQVRGHTDSTGSADANQTLSEERARVVADYLTSHGISAAEVTTVGLASTQPLAEETTEEGMRFNRRVEIVVRVP